MIDQTNYETWFLLYADGELSDKEQEMVLRFAEQHPELKAELDAMVQLRFHPDEGIQFPDRPALLKEESKASEDLYRFEPDISITFPDKSTLFRKATPVRFLWIRALSAAAAVTLIVGLFGLLTNKEDESMGSSSLSVVSSISLAPSNNTGEQQHSVVGVAGQEREKVRAFPLVRTTSGVVVRSTAVQVSKAVESEPLQSPELVVQQPTDAKTSIEKAAIDKSPTEKQGEALVPASTQSNFTEAALASARERETAEAVLNTEVFIQAALKDEKSTPFRGLIRKISRRVFHDGEDDDAHRHIRVAVFTIPVQKN